ncbi:MAG: type III-A CRISPR-associated RAMP protein Csm5 [Bacteroidia bacterium]
MNTSEQIVSFNIRLTTESPVSIGADKAHVLSPYADYVVSHDGTQLHYIDKQKLEALLGNNLELRTAFIEELRSGILNKTRSEFDFSDFVSRQMGGSVESITRETVKSYGLERNKRQQIQSVIKSAGKLYIPGSSLKGAIRTAILYDWLDKTTEGEEVMRSAYKEMEKAYHLIAEKKELELRKKTERRLSDADFQKMKELGKAFSRQIRILDREILKEDKLFGNIHQKERGPDSQQIQVSDSSFFDAQALTVYQAERIRMNPLDEKARSRADQSQIPQPRECIDIGGTAEFRLNLLPDKIFNKTLHYLKSDSANRLLEIIHDFSADCIENEIYNLESATDMPDTHARNALLRFYRDLSDRSEKGEIFIRLGLGKTVFDNSLLLAMMNYAEDLHEDGEEAFLRYREVLFNVNPRKEFFPVTRTVTTYKNLPMGWVKLELL